MTSDAQQLSTAMTSAALVLIDTLGLRIDDEQRQPPRVDLDKLPLGGTRAAQIALEYLFVGVGILDAAIEGDEPEPLTDEGLAHFTAGGPR